MSGIRTAKFKELETIAGFQVLMAQETEGLALNKAEIVKGIEAIFEDPGKGQYYVATNEEDEVIACLLVTPEWSEWRNGTVLWIQSVYVQKEFRGQGIFKRLYTQLKKMVEEDQGLIGLRLYVDKTNIKAQEVYKKLGMNGEHYKLFEWIK